MALKKTTCFIIKFILMTGLMSSSMAFADNICKSGSAAPGTNKLVMRLDQLQPYYSVPVGGILGTASIHSTIRCDQNSEYDWVLQNVLASPGDYDATTCRTPLDGVGVRYKRPSGGNLPCTDWDAIIRISKPRAARDYMLSLPVAAEFVRTKAVTSLPSGTHQMHLPPSSRLEAHLAGSNDGKKWGSYVFEAHTPLIVSNCTFATTTHVNFGRRRVNELNTIEEPFQLKFSNCGDALAAKFFNDSMKIKFVSGQIQGGLLKNDTCADCAKNVSIMVRKEHGLMISLSQPYVLKDGVYEINQDTIIHKFRAILIRSAGSGGGGAGAPTPGRIQSVLTVVLTSL